MDTYFFKISSNIALPNIALPIYLTVKITPMISYELTVKHQLQRGNEKKCINYMICYKIKSNVTSFFILKFTFKKHNNIRYKTISKEFLPRYHFKGSIIYAVVTVKLE